MPKRVRTQTIIGGPQGEDAKVVILMPTYGESRQYTKQLTLLERKINALIQQSESGDDPDETLATNLEALTDQLSTATSVYLSSHLLEWNWVDDNDDPLPKPHNDETVIDNLTNEEIAFVRDALNGATAQQEDGRKKLRMKS